MRAELVTGPTELPVSVEELRRHLWTVQDADTTDAPYLQGLLASATSHVETITSRKLVSQTWRGYLDEWPARGMAIELPFGVVTSVTRFNWLGDDAIDHVLISGTHYHASLAGYFPRVVPIDRAWPIGTLFAVDPIRIEFVAGFGAGKDVPQDIRHALLQLAAHWYVNREIVRVGNMVSPLPTVFDALISPWRIRHV